MIKVLGIDNVLHAVGDYEEAKQFYGVRLGLAMKFEVPAAGIALFNLGREDPGLLIRRQDMAPPRVWLEVPDAKAVAAELGGAEREIQTGFVVEITDPWGNVIGFTDYTKMPSRARKADSG
jgi:predicted enzyme related to lactoylglutathione lyase